MDASRRFYKVKVKAELFEIDVRYTDLVYIASGAYGYVCSAQDNVRVLFGMRSALCVFETLGRDSAAMQPLCNSTSGTF